MLLAEPVHKRAYRSKQERRAIVEETMHPGSSVAVVARRHAVSAALVYEWRALYRSGRLDAEPIAAVFSALPASRCPSRSASTAQVRDSILARVGRMKH